MSSNIHNPTVIEAKGLSKTYFIYDTPKARLQQSLWRGRRKFYREFNALREVSFAIGRGETVGIVGRNGSGKSTLLQIICGTLEPTRGECMVTGRVSALLELGAGFNPEFTGRENVYLNGAILGLSKEEITEKYEAIVDFAGIRDYMEQPVKTYSSGMYVRLAFAVAAASDPDILIVDEALAVGDEIFQRKCFARIEAIQEKGGTILFVSHAASTITQICDKAFLLDGGELLLSDTPKRVVSYYHKLLFAEADKSAQVREEIKALQGKEQLISSMVEKAELHAEYDPNLIPETTVTYESRGAWIRNPHIETLSGKQVNHLIRRQTYYYCYEVFFEKPAYGVRCGMLIKTKSGVELGGSGTATEPEVIPEVKAGQILHIRFQFQALLLPGTYFINCGCSAIEVEERIFLHRIVDACMFTVMPEGELKEGGIVDFMIEPNVTIIEQGVTDDR